LRITGSHNTPNGIFCPIGGKTNHTRQIATYSDNLSHECNRSQPVSAASAQLPCKPLALPMQSQCNRDQAGAQQSAVSHCGTMGSRCHDEWAKRGYYQRLAPEPALDYLPMIVRRYFNASA